MCRRKVSCDEMSQLVGRACFSTAGCFGTLLLKAKSVKKSLVLFTDSQELRVNKQGEIIDLSPMEFIQADDIMASMNLGLTNDAKMLWVRALDTSAMPLPRNGGGVEASEPQAEEVSAMIIDDWNFAEARGVKLVGPIRATHWLVCQPRSSAEKLHWKTLRRDATCGLWQTEENVFFLVPVGYTNIVQEKTKEVDLTEFYTQNGRPFRKKYDLLLDEPFQKARQAELAEIARQDALPWLCKEAKGRLESLAKMIRSMVAAFWQVYGEAPKVSLDEEQGTLFFSGEPHELSNQTLYEFDQEVERLAEAYEEFERASKMATAYRNVLADYRDLTVHDYYGVVERTMARKPRWLKTAEVELLADRAVIRVFKGDQELTRLHQEFPYDSYDNVTSFEGQLASLTGRRKNMAAEYDYDDEPQLPKANKAFNFFFGKNLA